MLSSFNVLIKQIYKILYSKNGGGYKEWQMKTHGDDYSITRHLVFMTYLNDVKDGGTEIIVSEYKK